MGAPPRYKFCVDENLPAYMASHLAKLYKRHQFHPVQSLNLLGTEDMDLFQRLSDDGFSAIITTDVNQVKLEDPAERQALRAAGLHWIGTKQQLGVGRGGISRVSATVEAGIGEVLATWNKQPTLYWIHPLGAKIAVPVLL